MFVRRLAALAAAMLLFATLPSDASAQVRASELGKVAQAVDGTTITVVA
ncbi:MAG: hypothetical protein HKM89_14645, partial [Gemmatimonadales bacterium]|nr:hypothetical protein [Gemmatimonadales bacterium]